MRQGAPDTAEQSGRKWKLVGLLVAGPSLVPSRLRIWVLAVTFVAIACLAGFGLAARHSGGPVLFDHRVDSFLRELGATEHRLSRYMDDIGRPKVFAIVTAAVALGLLLLRDYRAAVDAAVSVAIAAVLVERVLKPFFDRRLGDLPAPTFPSGHATVAVALAGALTLAAGRRRPLGHLLGPVGRPVLVTVVLVLGCSVGIGMVVLQFHHFSDVLAGIPLGLAISGGTAMALDAIAGWVQARLGEQP